MTGRRKPCRTMTCCRRSEEEGGGVSRFSAASPLTSHLALHHRYIVVLMAQAKIHWNRDNFQVVEKIFRKSVEVCTEDDTWKLNVAHVLFMQNKYKEAIGFYEPIVKKHYDNVRGRRTRVRWRMETDNLSFTFVSRRSSVTFRSVPAGANPR